MYCATVTEIDKEWKGEEEQGWAWSLRRKCEFGNFVQLNVPTKELEYRTVLSVPPLLDQEVLQFLPKLAYRRPSPGLKCKESSRPGTFGDSRQ